MFWGSTFESIPVLSKSTWGFLGKGSGDLEMGGDQDLGVQCVFVQGYILNNRKLEMDAPYCRLSSGW